MSNGKTATRVGFAAGLLLIAMVGLWLLLRPAEQSPPYSSRAAESALASVPANSSSSVEPGSVSTSMPPSMAPGSPPHAKRSGVRQVTPEAERLRARVLDSLPSRQRGHVAEKATSSKPSAVAPTPGTMVDRTGELGAEAMRVLNHELMPLVGECYDQARERNPRLRGMLAVNVELAGAEEVGSIIEAVEEAQDINELEDEELIECVRQSAFSIQLPVPTKSGRTSRQLTMPFGDPVQEDAGR